MVTVDAGATTEVPVTITALPASGCPTRSNGYVTFDPVAGDEYATSLVVPYAGCDGDHAYEMGLLGFWNLTEDSQAVEGDRTFTLSEGDYPVIDAFFGHFPADDGGPRRERAVRAAGPRLRGGSPAPQPVGGRCTRQRRTASRAGTGPLSGGRRVR